MRKHLKDWLKVVVWLVLDGSNGDLSMRNFTVLKLTAAMTGISEHLCALRLIDSKRCILWASIQEVFTNKPYQPIARDVKRAVSRENSRLTSVVILSTALDQCLFEDKTWIVVYLHCSLVLLWRLIKVLTVCSRKNVPFSLARRGWSKSINKMDLQSVSIATHFRRAGFM